MAHLRDILIVSAAAVMVASPAFAADLLPTKKGPPPAPIVQPFSWTGFYGGVQGGYGWGAESDNFDAISGYALDHIGTSGAIGGAHIGYNYQYPNSFVIGLYGELDASGLSGGKSAHIVGQEGTIVSSLSMRNTWQGFALARAGVAFDRLFIYGTGGLAVADDKETYYVNDPSFPPAWAGSQTNTLFGWAVGLGADYAFSDRWSMNTEVRYADFGRASYSIPASLSLSGNATSFNAGFTETLVQVGLSYHF